MATPFGCAGHKSEAPSDKLGAFVGDEKKDSAAAAAGRHVAYLVDSLEPAQEQPPAKDTDSTRQIPPARHAPERKIIYSVSLDVAVTDFSSVQSDVEAIVKKYPGAYVATTSISGNPGWRRQGEWKIRVPQDRYESCVADLRKLGEVRRETKQSQEVTEEFYDLTARLKNARETEQRLLKLQQDEKQTGQLEHLLAVEREISRVRQEVEQMQGRLERLRDLTSLTTISLTVEEIRSFQGAALPFAERIRATWGDSLATLFEAGENAMLFAVGLTPWLPLILLVLFAARFAWRRLWPGRTKPAAA